MMKKMILTVAAVAAVAVSAKAQAVYAQAGDPTTISSLTDASAQGGVTYEWYRNGALIPDCNEASCHIPANLATGTNVKFQRRAIALGCAIGNTSNANVVTITFCNVVIDGACWSDVHVNGWRTFADQADANTTFFQFNRTKAWAANDPLSGTWNITPINENSSWHVDSSPCPAGWRVPEITEYAALAANSHPADGVWAAANSGKGNSIAGRFLGKRANDCSLPDDMVGCVFFPASGDRYDPGTIIGRGTTGYAWSNTQVSNTNGRYLRVSATSVTHLTTSFNKRDGFPVRCVR